MVTGSFLFGFHVPFPILLLINFHPYIFTSIKTKGTHLTVAMETYVVICFFVLKQKYYVIHFLFITCKNKLKSTQETKSMMSNKHSSVESLYLYADRVFGYENWSHEIKQSN